MEWLNVDDCIRQGRVFVQVELAKNTFNNIHRIINMSSTFRNNTESITKHEEKCFVNVPVIGMPNA